MPEGVGLSAQERMPMYSLRRDIWEGCFVVVCRPDARMVLEVEGREREMFARDVGSVVTGWGCA